ncbi:formate dehydrogenase subunit delta [Chitinasiproducens palmae]|uniref:Formate dehydrogenase delta subunit n=1 Tax=Chitinasiproducens palmae TaxID=1770053 RepID=A0A1H2PIQ0_9BURK|nr:formate dehydrogenase subunit delta [Chitinasiproducens palmae]SDV46125.1 formate dehydrogenase delta subunit [Chitinasiproducens palmae]
MNVDNLVTMANQIGGFFESQPDRAASLDAISDHIRKFWAPRMRRALLETLDTDAAEQLSPIVRTALERDRAMLTPAS